MKMTITIPSDETILVVFGSGEEWCFFTAWIATLCLDHITLNQGQETLKKTDQIYLKLCQMFPWCDQPCVLLIRCQKTWDLASRIFRHGKFIAQKIFNTVTWYADTIGYLISSKSPIIHHCVVKTFNIFLGGDCGQDVQILGNLQESPFPSYIQMPILHCR